LDCNQSEEPIGHSLDFERGALQEHGEHIARARCMRSIISVIGCIDSLGCTFLCQSYFISVEENELVKVSLGNYIIKLLPKLIKIRVVEYILKII
jgi:hypothetical protein